MKRGSEHTRVQKQGRDRDNNTCQVCGSTNKPEGHHIVNYQYGGAANVDNIVTLCHDCHVDVHNGKIDLVKF